MKPWRHRDKPSEYYLGAILRAYDRAKKEGGQPTPSKLWDYVVMECLRSSGGFRTMFAWDRRKSVNRVGDIMEVIEAGWVPGVRLEQQDGKAVVVEAGAP